MENVVVANDGERDGGLPYTDVRLKAVISMRGYTQFRWPSERPDEHLWFTTPSTSKGQEFDDKDRGREAAEGWLGRGGDVPYPY